MGEDEPEDVGDGNSTVDGGDDEEGEVDWSIDDAWVACLTFLIIKSCLTCGGGSLSALITVDQENVEKMVRTFS